MWEAVRAGRREGAGWRRRKRMAQLKAVGARARAERTRNMSPMFVTLDVSKLSGWLNAFAFCRVEGRVYAMWEKVRSGRREDVGWRRRNRHVHGESPTQGCGGRARAERTWNMSPMFVTLDVSKLSGWLNLYAYCRVEGRACDAGRGVAREA